MNTENKWTIRLWFFELTLTPLPKGSFVGKRNLALFHNHKKIFKF